MRADKEVAIAAIGNDVYSSKYVSKTLESDYDVISTIKENAPNSATIDYCDSMLAKIESNNSHKL